MERFPITKAGFENLKDELNKLKTVERPKVITAIADAREHGDLKENAEYHSAREKQGFIEGRILEIEDKISRAHIVIPAEITEDKILFGATVTIEDAESEESSTYQIVSEYEADLSKNLISLTSPIARALMGKCEEDEVTVKTPKGNREYIITAVEYK